MSGNTENLRELLGPTRQLARMPSNGNNAIIEELSFIKEELTNVSQTVEGLAHGFADVKDNTEITVQANTEIVERIKSHAEDTKNLVKTIGERIKNKNNKEKALILINIFWEMSVMNLAMCKMFLSYTWMPLQQVPLGIGYVIQVLIAYCLLWSWLWFHLFIVTLLGGLGRLNVGRLLNTLILFVARTGGIITFWIARMSYRLLAPALTEMFRVPVTLASDVTYSIVNNNSHGVLSALRPQITEYMTEPAEKVVAFVSVNVVDFLNEAITQAVNKAIGAIPDFGLQTSFGAAGEGLNVATAAVKDLVGRSGMRGLMSAVSSSAGLSGGAGSVKNHENNNYVEDFVKSFEEDLAKEFDIDFNVKAKKETDKTINLLFDVLLLQLDISTSFVLLNLHVLQFYFKLDMIKRASDELPAVIPLISGSKTIFNDPTHELYNVDIPIVSKTSSRIFETPISKRSKRGSESRISKSESRSSKRGSEKSKRGSEKSKRGTKSKSRSSKSERSKRGSKSRSSKSERSKRGSKSKTRRRLFDTPGLPPVNEVRV